MKLEESVRASVAKASYRKHVEKTLGETFALHEENLEFAVVEIVRGVLQWARG